jgi:hypothetical protein
MFCLEIVIKMLMDRGMTSAVVGCHFDINESVIYQ